MQKYSPGLLEMNPKLSIKYKRYKVTLKPALSAIQCRVHFVF